MTVVTCEIRDAIAHVIIDNPPVNALSQAVRAGLMDACSRIAQAQVRPVVLSCAGRTFVAGADIRELGKTPLEPYLPDVLAGIEASQVPWVAAIHGTALGGGLELSMACHGRFAAAGAKLGLPEVTLGIIPGSGGTVRLPRLVPMAEAVTLVTTGKPIGADVAAKIGLVDRLSNRDLRAEAEAYADELARRGAPQPTITRPLRSGEAVDWAAQAAHLQKKSRGAAAPLEALAALKDTSQMTGPQALAAERARFLKLAASEESAALRHIFFAERGAGQALKADDAEPADLSRVGARGTSTRRHRQHAHSPARTGPPDAPQAAGRVGRTGRAAEDNSSFTPPSLRPFIRARTAAQDDA